MTELGRSAIGTWSGGRYMRFGEAISDDRLEALFRPGDGIDTVITADVYGEGEADRTLGRALAGLDRDSYRVAGAIGHDFIHGERQGPKGFPRFTDPSLRGPDGYASYLREAAEREPRGRRHRPLRRPPPPQPRPHGLRVAGGLGGHGGASRRRPRARDRRRARAPRTASRST